MKVCLDADEWYPVYSAVREGESCYDDRDAVEVDAETIARWEKAALAFKMVQEEMSAARQGEA